VDAPVNTLGIRRVMFAVDGIDAVVARMRAHGAELIGEMRYEDKYRLAYIRGPEASLLRLPSRPAEECLVASETRLGTVDVDSLSSRPLGVASRRLNFHR